MSERRPPEIEARYAIGVMLAIMVILVIIVLAVDGLSTSAKSIILIGWMAAMMYILRRYQ